MAAAVGALLSTLLKIISEFAAMPEMGIGAMLFSSSWGWSVVIAALAAVMAFVGFWRIHSATSSSRINAWRVVLIAAIALVVTPAFGGHAISSDQAWIAVPADIVHVTAGSMWIGTLAVIVFVAISACLKTPDGVSPGARLAALINAFSPLALICGGSVVATGIAASLIHAPHFSSLLTYAFWTTPYGSALFRKLIFVVLLFFAGAWNWRRMKPRLGADDALVPLRRSATIELLLGGTVLGLTAILVALELP
jgi:putative copper export protein